MQLKLLHYVALTLIQMKCKTKKFPLISNQEHNLFPYRKRRFVSTSSREDRVLFRRTMVYRALLPTHFAKPKCTISPNARVFYLNKSQMTCYPLFQKNNQSPLKAKIRDKIFLASSH
jgi:hypothetical protein